MEVLFALALMGEVAVLRAPGNEAVKSEIERAARGLKLGCGLAAHEGCADAEPAQAPRGFLVSWRMKILRVVVVDGVFTDQLPVAFVDILEGAVHLLRLTLV